MTRIMYVFACRYLYLDTQDHGANQWFLVWFYGTRCFPGFYLSWKQFGAAFHSRNYSVSCKIHTNAQSGGQKSLNMTRNMYVFLHPTIRIQLHRTIAQTNGFVGGMKGLQAAFPKVCGPDAFRTTFLKQKM